MSHASGKLRDEIVRLLPAMVFFFAAFNLIVLTENLTDEQYGIRVFRFTSAAISALLIAKVVLLVDFLPFVDAFRSRPLIYNTLWKTLIYVLVAVLFIYLEHMIPLLLKHHSVITAHQQLVLELVWPRVSAILIWLAVLFFLFAATQELSRALGGQQLRRLFLGR